MREGSKSKNDNGSLLTLVRHGQSEGNVKRLWEGARSDSPLTALGEKQAEATGEHLKDEMQGVTIYCSPMRRARQTAARIAGHTRGRVEVVADLIEIDWGDLEGLTTKQVGERFPAVLQYWGTKLSSHIPGGDAATTVGERMAEAVERIMATEGNGSQALIVSHQGAIAMGLMHLFQRWDALEEFQLPNCAIHRLRFNPTPEIEVLASHEHLTSRGIESKKWSF